MNSDTFRKPHTPPPDNEAENFGRKHVADMVLLKTKLVPLLRIMEDINRQTQIYKVNMQITVNGKQISWEGNFR